MSNWANDRSKFKQSSSKKYVMSFYHVCICCKLGQSEVFINHNKYIIASIVLLLVVRTLSHFSLKTLKYMGAVKVWMARETLIMPAVSDMTDFLEWFLQLKSRYYWIKIRIAFNSRQTVLKLNLTQLVKTCKMFQQILLTFLVLSLIKSNTSLKIESTNNEGNLAKPTAHLAQIVWNWQEIG